MITAFLCVAVLFSLCSCAHGGETRRSIYAMDTVIDMRIYPENESLASELCDIVYELDGVLSAHGGEVGKLNDARSGELSEHIVNILSRSEELFRETDGMFSPYLGSVIELWGVGEKNYVPTEDEIKSALLTALSENVRIMDNRVKLSDGVRLNFGAIGKGYATDVLRKKLSGSDVRGAIISLGGNVYVHGTKEDGSLWNVAIRDPKRSANDWVLSLSLRDKFVVSSGDYERYFERDGKRYHHILDARTGYPCESDLLSVSVICDEGARADAYSTALYAMGRDEALRFWRESDGFELVLIGRDGKITLTEGLSDIYTAGDGGYDYEISTR